MSHSHVATVETKPIRKARQRKVCLGGAFDILHRGHKDLLDRAAAIGEQVLVGLCTDELANARRERKVRPYKEREERLLEHMTRQHNAVAVTIDPIDDPFGPARTGDFDTIVVSESTLGTAQQLNRERQTDGLRQLEIEVVPHRLAQDGRPISATRINLGEIDDEGRMLRALRLAIGSANPVKVKAVKQICDLLYDKVDYIFREVHSGVAEQPRGVDETVAGATLRAREALGEDMDMGIGIEAGLVPSPLEGQWLDVQYCAVVDRTGRVTLGHGPGFAYPTRVMESVDAGHTVGQAMTSLTGIQDIGRKGGAIGYLSMGVLERQGLTEQAVLAAFIPRLRQELYLEAPGDDSGV